MLIGVMSDTHGRLDSTAQAVRLLLARGISQIIHCGDVGTTRVLDLFVGIPTAFVYGNTDYDTHSLQRYAEALGMSCYGKMGRMTIAGVVVSFLHGDDSRAMHQLIEAQDCSLLLHGHTHVRRVEDVGKVRIVNPGALHRANPRTVATIDPATREVRFIEVP